MLAATRAAGCRSRVPRAARDASFGKRSASAGRIAVLIGVAVIALVGLAVGVELRAWVGADADSVPHGP